MTILKNYLLMCFRSMAVLILAVFIFSSCKKEQDVISPTATVSIEGLYAGKYGFDDEEPDSPEKYKIVAGGVFQQISISSGYVVGNGTWLLNGNILTATVTSNFAPYYKESIRATFDNTSGKLTGTWGWEFNYNDGGKIELTKQ